MWWGLCFYVPKVLWIDKVQEVSGPSRMEGAEGPGDNPLLLPAALRGLSCTGMSHQGIFIRPFARHFMYFQHLENWTADHLNSSAFPVGSLVS